MLALGGGSVLAAPTRERLRGHRVVLLWVGLADGLRRTGMSTARPLLAGVNPRATFKALLEARAPLYREVATVEVDTSRRSANQVARAVLEASAHWPPGDPADPVDDVDSAGPADGSGSDGRSPRSADPTVGRPPGVTAPAWSGRPEHTPYSRRVDDRDRNRSLLDGRLAGRRPDRGRRRRGRTRC